MEIRLNVGDKIQIPTDCTVALEGDLIIIKERLQEFHGVDEDFKHSRPRAKIGWEYLALDIRGNVLEYTENDAPFDDLNYDTGNYYLPSERAQAELAAKFIRAIFEKRLKV